MAKALGLLTRQGNPLIVDPPYANSTPLQNPRRLQLLKNICDFKTFLNQSLKCAPLKWPRLETPILEETENPARQIC